jgi:peptidoglycan L-alanyl-D-glutamate endopeptidase CwlK
MVNSRDLNDLLPPVKRRAQSLVDACRAVGIDILITCTLRDEAAQAALYAQGRTKPGPRVTNAKPGQSAHQYRVAFDLVPLRSGKPVWGTTGVDKALWQRVGTLGESLGLEWAGRWTSFPEFPHFQYLGGLSIADLKAGKVPQ